MEVRELAERVLFSESLAEKLAPPEHPLVDRAPGAALAIPAAPGRPANLRMRHDGMRERFPGSTRLDGERERGVLLHFFANHELLAAELMALVLLRFPNAPLAFRRGLAATLQEEQEHTRLYIERMEACGVEFGSLPVNGFFWRSIAQVGSPVDYVTRLSLTFEQANLDYARHYAGVFTALGDSATASLFERIYRDEIGHVRYGLTWFRRWKDARSSDWEAYRTSLAYPLSPARARGAAARFNREGRLRAGLDEEFVDRLEVFQQSSGRMPDVYWFNPDAEDELGFRGAEKREPSRRAAAMCRDLETVMLFLARRDDVVLLRREPALAFRRLWLEAGVCLPESSSLEGLVASGRRVGSVRPWAWTPESARVLTPVMDRATKEEGGWNPRLEELFSKAENGMRETLWAGSAPDWLGCERSRSIVCRDEVEVRGAFGRMFEEGWTEVVCKAAFGCAGRSQVRLRAAEAAPEAVAGRIRGWLETQGIVVVEPWYSRVFDFSVQYEAGEGGQVKLLGFTRLHVDEGGKFRGCSVERDLAAGMGAEAARFVHGGGDALRAFYRGTVAELLAAECRERGYRGPVGVDAFVYRDGNGRLRLRPLVELNPRFTMGRVTLELSRRIPAGVRVIFEIVTRSRLRAAGFRDFAEFGRCLRHSNPLEVSEKGMRRLRRGALPLNDPSAVEACLPVLRAGDNSWSLDYALEREREFIR